MRHLVAKHPHAHLEILGDGPMRQGVEDLIACLGLRNNVTLLGWRSDVPARLARAMCFLLTSAYEGCPLSVLEAMAAGLPVVSTRVGGIDEVIDEGVTGRIVDPDPRAVSDALEELISNPVVASRMGAAGFAKARLEFSRERMAEANQIVYKSMATDVLNERPHAS
jgi:glycosyltransferase involved in cell wall biosynthesis